MGVWGVGAFDNDAALDWVDSLGSVNDLSLIDGAFRDVENIDDKFLEQERACIALAGCEVLARLNGRLGSGKGCTDTADHWIAANAIHAPLSLVKRALLVINRILGSASELADLWDASGEGETWRKSVDELRQRLMQ